MLHKNYSLKTYNTLGIDVRSSLFFSFENVEELEHFAKKDMEEKKSKFFILGGGSNVLFTKDFDGLVLHSRILDKKIVAQDKNHISINAGSGIEWDDFVDYCVKNKYYGVENLSLIPGNIGAAPVQNIGAYGTEIMDYIEGVHAYDIYKKQRRYLSNEECQFSYRNSIFKKKEYKTLIITSVVFNLSKVPPYKQQIRAYKGNAIVRQFKHLAGVTGDVFRAVKTLKINFKKKSVSVDYRYLKAVFENTGLVSISKARQTIINKRNSKLPDPKTIGNVGSFFKNPIVPKAKAEKIKEEYPKSVLYPFEENRTKISAGWLINECGWRGKNDPNVGLYKDQTLVIVNLGEATGPEIVNYSKKIKDSVLNKFDIELEEEVVII